MKLDEEEEEEEEEEEIEWKNGSEEGEVIKDMKMGDSEEIRGKGEERRGRFIWGGRVKG